MPRRESDAPLPDAAARQRIVTDLGTNLLVEAGAGSGKTTALVQRMVALVRDEGVEVERIAAVTFTRKAAGELRERFQGLLESARTDSSPGSEARTRLDRALGSVDRAFMGTIHAFCARLLRERPLEAGLDPAFSELTQPQTVLLGTRWWNVWLERLAAEGDAMLDALEGVGIRPDQLVDTFGVLGENSDVDFPAPAVAPPDASEIQALRADVEQLMATADVIFPAEEPAKGWDELQRALRTAWFVRRALDWHDDRVFLDVATLLRARAGGITLNRWFPKRNEQAPIKALRQAFEDWASEGSRADRLLRRWLAHRYPVALEFALRAAREFAAYRRRTGQLSFHDLLMLAVELLRHAPGAREDLGARYRYLLVDEFQDTDPLQAELLFLLASEPRAGGGEAAEPAADQGASEAPAMGEREAEGADDWRHATPRPGALFVVGDPKQSIYRFRRADIALYQQVRERFDGRRGGFGDVLLLTANFRSRPPVGELVNGVFRPDAGFPTEPTRHQAAFAPLEPQRAEAHPREGVYVHHVPTEGTVVDDDGTAPDGRDLEARALAGWIARRVRDEGDREAGEFLILTRNKGHLDRYARALEARNLPVEVSGAGVGIEEELAELKHVLGALTDPDDAVRTVAALTGLFFGLDLEQLLAHRERIVAEDVRHARGAFDFRFAPPVEAADHEAVAATDPVRAALGTLHRWWQRAREAPADVVVAEMIDELGLLPWAAAGELGQIRAGALAYALDAVSGAGLDGDTSLVGALESLEAALSEDEAEAPLEPGRADAIRLMNLHKAKGLQADVVILADPFSRTGSGTRLLVERDDEGRVAGWVRVGEPRQWGGFDELAQPLEWPDREAAEEHFDAAEAIRLLYVATTRAGQELVVTRPEADKAAEKSQWSFLHPWLAEHATVLELPSDPPGPRDRLEVGVEDMARRVDDARTRRETAGEASYRFDTVTALVRRARGHADVGEAGEAEAGEGEAREGEADEGDVGGGDAGERDGEPLVAEARLEYALSEGDSAGPGGMEWGSAVHTVLQAAIQGLDDDSLAAVARTALFENDRPVHHGEPTELATLLALVEAVRRSPLWERARRAEVLLAEHPFVLEEADGRYLEGVIDLAFREDGRWVVVDYKTDRMAAAAPAVRPPDAAAPDAAAPDAAPPPDRAPGDGPLPPAHAPARREEYRAQVARYGEALAALTGEPVAEARVWYLRGGALERDEP